MISDLEPTVSRNPSEDSISILDVFSEFKFVILASTLACAFLAFMLASQMSRAYRAEIVVSPVADSSKADLLTAVGSQFGGLGALAGIGLGGDSGRNERIATLKSRDLGKKFIDNHRLISLFCDEKVIRCQPKSSQAIPSERDANQALKLFMRRVLSVNEDKRSGLVRISVTWRDRNLAAQWANEYVGLANRELLAKSVAESKRRIEFLRNTAESAQPTELREAAYNLMESELKAVMVATSRTDYGFAIIDPALVPDVREFVRPHRALLSVAGGIFGVLMSTALLLLHIQRKKGGQNSEASV